MTTTAPVMAAPVMAPTMPETLEALRPVTLAEVEARASLQTRVDRKYVVPLAVAQELVADLAGAAAVLRIDGMRTFRYESVYFDAPDLQMYLAAARGRPRRTKVRTRTYLDSGLCMLEVKTRDAQGRTVKHRRPHRAAARDRLLVEGERFVAEVAGQQVPGQQVPGQEVAGSWLRPTLTTRFTRSTLLVDDGAARLTLDADLSMEAVDGALAVLPDVVVVETKSPGAPTRADRLLWAAHYRPARVSKYGAGMAALHPDLPRNRWARVVREHVVPA